MQENNGDEILTVAKEATTSDGNGVYDGLEDLSTQQEPNSVGDVSFPIMWKSMPCSMLC